MSYATAACLIAMAVTWCIGIVTSDVRMKRMGLLFAALTILLGAASS